MWYTVVTTVGIGRAAIAVTRTNSGQEFKQDSKAANSTVACEAHHNTLPLTPFIKWDLAAKSLGAHNSVHFVMSLDILLFSQRLTTISMAAPKRRRLY